jgi:hypothetical protein
MSHYNYTNKNMSRSLKSHHAQSDTKFTLGKPTMGGNPSNPSSRRISNQEPQVKCHNEEALVEQNVCSSRKNT